MAEEPEEVLPHHCGAAGVGVEEVGTEEAIEEQHDLRGRQGRQGHHGHAGHHQHHPDVERHAAETHPATPHGQRGRNEVDGGRHRPESHHEDGEVPVIRAVARREGPPGEWRIGEPSDVGRGACPVQPVAAQKTEVKQKPAEQKGPEAEGVQSRKREVAGADHQRHQVVGEAEYDRDADQEHHGGPVYREQPVEDLRRDDRVAGRGQLPANHGRLEAGDQEEREAGDHVHDAETLVVDGDDPFVESREQAGWLALGVSGRDRRGNDAHVLLRPQRSVTRYATS